MSRGAEHLWDRARRAYEWRWDRLVRLQRHLRLEWGLSRVADEDRRKLEEARAGHEAEYRHLTNPLVSVVIATYNRGKLLVERTLPSIFKQSYQHFEVVIVGDCCSDDTAQRLRAMGDSRIRFYNLPERYPYPKRPEQMFCIQGFRACNAATEHARGAWLAHMDDDDVLLPHHLESLLSCGVTGGYEFVFARHSVEIAPGVWERGGEPGAFPTGRWPFRGNVVPHRTVVYRRYLRLFGYRGDAWKYRIGGDYQLFLRMGRAGVRAGFLDRVVALKHLPAPYAGGAAPSDGAPAPCVLADAARR